VADAGHGPRFALPRGATRVELHGESRERAQFKDGALELVGPAPLGVRFLDVSFELPATKGSIAWFLDLPNGSFNSSLRFVPERGLSIDELSPGVTLDIESAPQIRYLVVDDLSLTPNQAIAMTIHLPRPGPDNAVLHACGRLEPAVTAMVGQPIDFTLGQLGGGSLRLSSLRGKPVLVNLMATWASTSTVERPRLADLVKRASGLAIVMVASDRDPAVVATTVGALPFPVVIDPPAKPDHYIGATTSSWGVKAVPESLLVDRKGIVRFHFQEARDWDAPEALRCIRAFAAAP
jgi:peroxiredoxin